jgi:hypothetical protein
VNPGINAAYEEKYGRYGDSYTAMTTPEVRSTTLRLVPR